MAEVYKVLHDPGHKWHQWSCVDKHGFTQWASGDEQFIRRFATDPAFREWVAEQNIKGAELSMKLRQP